MSCPKRVTFFHFEQDIDMDEEVFGPLKAMCHHAKYYSPPTMPSHNQLIKTTKTLALHVWRHTPKA
jgi:hypothetical protein